MVRMLVIVVLVSVLVASFVPAVSAAPKKALAKNVIILISDGWGYNHIESTNYWLDGTTGQQVYEKFPFQYAMSTYMVPGGYDPALAWADFDYVKSGATDSAAAATAMSTGIKTYSGAIGVGLDGQNLWHAMQEAELLGKSTGVVTSVEWTHATPAGFVAHNVSRNNYAEIGEEMVYDSATDVIMGAGHPWFGHSGESLTTPNTYKYVGGDTTWNDLVAGTAGGDADDDGVADPWYLVQDRAAFQALMEGPTPKRVLGTAQVYQTLQQSRSGDGYADPYVVPLIETVPTLEEMTKAALNILDNDDDGFMLMVEGGAVDWASHANQSGRMIEEQIDFNNAVQAVVDWVKANSNWGETLVIVTGDHECGYLTGTSSDPTWEPVVNNGAGVLPGMEWHSGNHTNALIPFFAKGDAARLFVHQADDSDPVRGRYIDNTEIADVVFETLDPH
jgi:alkaline phosphatase